MDETTANRKPGKKRIMVQVWDTLASAIKRDFKALNIKRDRYLSNLFGSEIDRLAEEVTFRNADEVRQRLVDRRLPKRVKWTLELDEDVAGRLDRVLTERNIPRDSFINRVLFFLVAKEGTLKRLGVDFKAKGYVSAKPLEDALGFLYDPFFHIREANDECFYTVPWFPDSTIASNWPNLFALNTAISADDWKLMNRTLDSDFGLHGLGFTDPVEVAHE